MRLVALFAVPLALHAWIEGVHPRGHDREGLPATATPQPLYADDPQHLLNRLHARLFVAELMPDEVGAALPAERRAAGKSGDEFFAAKWYFGKRAGESADRGLFGGDVRFSPVRELRGALAEEVSALLGSLATKAQVDAIPELASPLVRLLLQWDLLSMWWRCERDGTADAPALGALAAAIRALAQPREVLEALDPGTAALRAALGGKVDAANTGDPYFPVDLLAGESAFVEIDREDKALFHAERSLRAVRAFVKVPAGRADGEALVRAAGAAGKDGPLPDVPVGTEVALVLSLLAIDPAGEVVATPVVDEIRVRRISGSAELAADNGSSRDGVSHWVYQRGRRASRDPQATHAFRFVPDTAQAMFLEYGTLKHTTYFAQCALCHRLTDTGKQNPAGITTLGRYAGAKICVDPATRLRRAEQQAAQIVTKLRARR